MGKARGFYKSDKRKKELTRQKKQEDKRLRRQGKAGAAEQETPGAVPEAPPSDSGVEGQDSSAD